MTFDPALPPLILGVVAVVLVGVRLIALRLAVGTGRGAFLRWGATTLALLLVLLAAARPGSGTVHDERPAKTAAGENIYFVVDRSADSAIADFGGTTRMSGMRDDIEAVIHAHPGARFAVIAFASRPAVDWPLSEDTWSLRPVIEALNPYPDAPADQVNAAAAANVLRYQLIAAGQQYPHSENLVYYLGSGAGRSTAPQGAFDTDAVDGGAVFGYDKGPGDATLRSVANQLGVPFVAREPGEALPRAAQPAPGTADQPAAGTANQRDEFYWYLAILASALLLAEIYLSARDLRRARSTRREVLP
ncbi:hypothetical protein Mycch_0646 [Mycolicibacterium chubuense NBB4]|uniref:VWFA domain-containing protein n=1 Tax=Mycolicibacterium chubuense (strain NBB4) TaxID=710421 RepID=I4BDV7_MYCCN|nr:VWA domain-containing protein [Mycolicibacterium chubuense]AFM15464.1 hypothetical protein Mycch_0646 [Mycolicibacterium chubuense NBB4]